MPAHHHLHSIDAIRATSRRLVRELGFMSTDLAGTDQLQPEADHFMFLARGKTGPFRIDGEALRGTDPARIGVQLTLHDEGNGDRAVSAATLTFRVVG